jgi:hypothetical protein
MEHRGTHTMARAWVAVLMALVMAMGLVPHAAWAGTGTTDSSGSTDDATTFSVALTIVDESTSPATVVSNVKVDGMTADMTVADMLDAAGFTEVDSQDAVTDPATQYFASYGAPYFLGKGYDATTGNYWVTCFDGSSNNYASAMLDATLQDGGHYQYIYGTTDPVTYELTFSYTDEIADPLAAADDSDDSDDSDTSDTDTDGTSDTSNDDDSTTSTDTDGTDTSDDGTDATASVDVSAAAASYDATKTASLIDNLAARFAQGGSDASLTYAGAPDDPVYAALGLNALGRGSDIDTDALLANLASELDGEADGTYVSAGRLGKYVMALKAAGLDPTAVTINGTVRNLVDEMNTKYADTDHASQNTTVFSAVWVLAANDAAGVTSDNTDALIDTILASQSDAGLFGFSGYEDSETTAQALLALLPYQDRAEVASAISEGAQALRDAQQSDGRFAYNPADLSSATSDIDATAYALAALVALGDDPTSDQMKAAVAYLTAQADDTLDGYRSAGMWNEFVTSSTVLMGLAAWQQATETGTAYDVYVPKAVEAADDASAATDAGTADEEETADEDSASATSTMPQTGDAAGAWTLVALVALGTAGTAGAVSRRRLQDEEDA